MLEAKKIFKSFDGKEILKGINLKVEKGEKVIIIGPSGSGKSTMLRCLNLLEKTDKGKIIFNGKEINNKTNVDQFRQVIMIAQNKFRELLTADSKERQKILQDIFETGIYQSVEKQLEEKNNALTEAMKEKNMAYEMLLSRLKEEKDERLISYLQTKLLNNTPEVSEILHDLIKEYRIYELMEGSYNAT